MTDEQIEVAANAIRAGEYSGNAEDFIDRTAAREIAKVALEAAEKAAWQPIEEAPKDGTTIELWNKGFALSPCHWEKNLDVPGWLWLSPVDFKVLEIIEPTHWRPLPAGPDVKKTEKS